MKEFLDHLEKDCGGDGIGVLFIEKGAITFNHKGEKFSNEQVVDALYGGKTPDWFMYHTRVASKGTISDSNCHPYTNEDSTFSLMMNGTDNSFGAFGKKEDITDTEVIFKLLDKTDIPLEGLIHLTPRFMGFKNGKVFVTNPKGSQSLEYISEGDYTIIASSFPRDYDEKELKNEFIWFEGEKLLEEPVIVRNNQWNTGLRDKSTVISGSWGDYYSKTYGSTVEEDAGCVYGYNDFKGNWIGKWTLEKVTKEQIETAIEMCRNSDVFDVHIDLTEYLEDMFGQVINYNNECVCFDYMNDKLLLSSPETYEVRYEFDIYKTDKKICDL